MRVLVTTDVFPPEAGGPARYVPIIAEALSQQGHTVRVLTYGREKVEPGDRAYPFHVCRISVSQGRLTRLTQACAALAQGLQWADLLYANGLLVEAALVNTVYRRPSAAKVVGDITWERARDKGWITDEFEEFQCKRYEWRIELRRAWRNWALRQMRAVIVPSAYLKRIVAGWGIEPERIQVIYNAFEPVSGDVAPAEIPLATSRRVITVCRLTAWKGVDGLIEAVSGLPDVGLVVLGDGPERENLEALAGRLGVRERVHFAGQVPAGQVVTYLKACDLFVLNSRYEGLPHVALEALSVGLPVIATDVGGTPEIVQNGVSGLLVPLGDTSSLREALARLLSDEPLRWRLAEGAPAQLANFNLAQMLERTEAILLEEASRQ